MLRRERQSVKPWHSYNLLCVVNAMTFENLMSRMGWDTKQFSERYAEHTPMHDQHLFYAYEPSQHSLGYTASKHHYAGGVHKSNAAMSALTLLAFLFFLHILQQCLKDHMTAMSTPQVMIMSAEKEGGDNIVKTLQAGKFDKTGVVVQYESIQTDRKHSQTNSQTNSQAAITSERQNRKDSNGIPNLNRISSTDFSPANVSMKVNAVENAPPNGVQKKTVFKNYGSFFSNYYDQFNNNS